MLFSRSLKQTRHSLEPALVSFSTSAVTPALQRTLSRSSRPPTRSSRPPTTSSSRPSSSRPPSSHSSEPSYRPARPLSKSRAAHLGRQQNAPFSRSEAPRVQQEEKNNTPRETNKYRSKHFDPSVVKPEGLPKLEPHVLSERLKKLCDEGKLEAAISMLKNSPHDAQNAIVWNTVIWECMKAKQFQQSYQLFTDMKRRGFSPTTRTYHTMFNGLVRIEDWAAYPKQLKNAESLFQHYMRHIESVHAHSPKSPELSSSPLALYLKLLGDAGRYQEIFDVYYNLDPKGPITPDHMVFTAMFQALSPLKIPYGMDSESTATQNASSAKLLWTQMIKVAKKTEFTIDAHLVASAIIALSKGRSSDQEFAFGIVREYLGLAVEAPDKKQPAPIDLSPPAFGAVLLLCQSSDKQALAFDLFKQVKKRRDASEIIDHGHVNEVFKARQAIDPAPQNAEFEVGILDWMLVSEAVKASNKDRKETLRPQMTTFLLALNACWRTKDYPSAIKAFQMMTGYQGHDFSDGVEKTPKFERYSHLLLPVTSENASLLVRTALASENRAFMRQALRLLHFLDLKLLASNARRTVGYDAPTSKKALKHQQFHAEKLASAVLDTLDHIYRNSTHRDAPQGQDLVRWKALKMAATGLLRDSNNGRFIPIKEAE
ncbi:hypothetical protein BDZ89DRAFT_938618 [Hymenopellis radicata]|nr:hypothetical protein BDZ89DRAFT_938618 [Hymenopellis radicata]